MRIRSLVLAGLMSSATLPLASPKEPSIRQIDFKNFIYPWGKTMEDGPAADYTDAAARPYVWLNPVPQLRTRVIKGMHHFYVSGEDPDEHSHDPLVSVDDVTYGDLDSDRIEEAAVHLNCSSGGTANWDFLYVYKLTDGHLKLFGILGAGSRAYGGLGRVAISGGFLILDFNDPDRRQGDCCSEGYIRVRFRWQNGHFVEEGPRERGDWPKQNQSAERPSAAEHFHTPLLPSLLTSSSSRVLQASPSRNRNRAL